MALHHPATNPPESWIKGRRWVGRMVIFGIQALFPIMQPRILTEKFVEELNEGRSTMALVPCRECNHQVSTKAKTCPNCGIGEPARSTAKDFWHGLIGLALIGGLIYWVWPSDTAQQETQEATVVAEPAEETTATVRIAVYDYTENNPLREKSEVWIRGLGSWWLWQDPGMEFGGSVKDVDRREIGREYAMFIYPDGRSGTELGVDFTITEEMCPDACARDMIVVEIFDNEVTAHGYPIEAANGTLTVEMSR